MAMLLFKSVITSSMVLALFLQTSCGTVPKNCYKSGINSFYCHPYIPSFLRLDGWNLSGVTEFRLDSSSSFVWTLQTLPSDIFQLANDIEYLYLKNAGLENLPCDVFKPFQKSLRKIVLSGNLFEEFPFCALKNFEVLEYVQLDNQRLKSFQADMISWKSLHTLLLDNNELIVFNISNFDSKNEVGIYLNNNKISTLQMFDTNNIRYLFARNNLIRHLNVNIFQNSKTTLLELDLSQNRLENSIWDALAGVTSLRALDLNNNQISVVSSHILNSTNNLEYLDLSNNQLKSLAGVALRSGKLEYLLLGSNKLTEIPTFLTSSAYTFNVSPQQYDLSNNSIEKINISIPSKVSSLTVRLDRNVLKEVSFDSNNIEIGTLNISHNDIHFLPYNLPKAKTYVLSYNPLNSADVIHKLTNEMLGASVIELENVGLFCEGNVHTLPTINGSGLSSLNLKHNCVPLDFICHIITPCTTCMSLYLDNNIATSLPCSLRDKCFNVLSVNELGLHDPVSEYLFGKLKPKHCKTLLSRHNNFTGIPLIHNSPVPDTDISYDFSGNQITTFDGFNISADRVNFNFKNNEISLIKPGKMLSSINDSLRLTLSFKNNSLIDVSEGVVSIYVLRDYIVNARITIDVSYNFIEKLTLRNFITFQTQHDTKFHGDFLMISDLNINLSHNNIQSIEDCFELDMYLTLDLTFNHITTLPNMSCGMVFEMYLGYNKIRGIFTPISSPITQVLDLQWNRITEIHFNAFDNLTQLTQLNLRGNMIEFFPSSVRKVRSLQILDISFNRIRHISQSHFYELKELQKLIITDNNFLIPVNDLQLRQFYHMEENEIHCDCDILFLRNQSFSPEFEVTGRCTLPSEYEGYHISCFPEGRCIGLVPLYITKTTIQTCQNDKYSDITMNIEEIENMLIIHVKIIGQRKQKRLSIKAYLNSKLIKEVQMNITDRIISFWLDRNLGPDNLCFSSVFHENDTVTRCFAVNIQSKYKSDKMESNNVILYGISSLFVISLIVNISIGLFTIFTYRNKHKNNDQQNSNVEINTESYAITGASNGDSSSQSVYEDIPDLERNDHEHSYSNLALDKENSTCT